MRLIGFAFILTVGLTLAPLAAEGQQTVKIYRVGWLSAGSAEIDESLVVGFRRGLRELGYVEGTSIVLEQSYAAGHPDRLPELAAELVRRKPNTILASGDAAALAAKKATSTIPVVFHVADAVGTGLVPSLARPAGNVTGISDLHADLIPKRLELLKLCVPALSRTAFLTNPTNPTCALQAKDLQAAAPAFAVTVLSVEATRAEDIDRGFATMKRDRSQALIVCGDRTLGTHRGQIFRLASKGQLPAIYSNRRFVEAGGLMSYGANLTDVYWRLASFVDKILKGAEPADLPVEQPTKFELVINLKTAKALGLTIPQTLLLRADHVIE